MCTRWGKKQYKRDRRCVFSVRMSEIENVLVSFIIFKKLTDDS